MIRYYNGNESGVKDGKGGFVKIRGIFMGLREYDSEARQMIGERYFIEELGWGISSGKFFSEYNFTPEEVERLKTTL